MENITCKECGTLNEPDYTYCKNCGAVLIKQGTPPPPQNAVPPIFQNPPPPVQQNVPPPVFQNNVPPYQSYNNYLGYNHMPPVYGAPPAYVNAPPPVFYSAPIPVDTIDSIPTDEFAAYIGKNARKILPKFATMELSRQKASWCWPVAVLSFFFGPLGAAIWFFYRKMYNWALLLAGVGTLLTVITSILNFDFTKDYYQYVWNSLSSYSFDALPTTASPVAAVINWLSPIACAVLTGIFGLSLYKKHAAKKIGDYRKSDVDPRYYRLGLSSLGGTSGGMLTVGILWLILAVYAPTFIALFLSLS